MVCRAPRRFLRRRSALWCCGLGVVVLAVGACGGGDGSGSPGPSRLERAARREVVAPGPVSVVAEDNVFEPEVVKVRSGVDVTFTNGGRNLHNVIPVDGGGFRIDTDELRPGTSKAIRITKPGTYRYYCSIHGTETRGMIGVIAVVR